MHSKKNKSQAILKQLAELETMSTEDLRKLWNELHEAQSASESEMMDSFRLKFLSCR